MAAHNIALADISLRYTMPVDRSLTNKEIAITIALASQTLFQCVT